MPTSRMARAEVCASSEMRAPSASRISALPHFPDSERLPCLATRAPAAATTNAAKVEMLKGSGSIATSAAGIEERNTVEAGVNGNGLFAHSCGEAEQLSGGLALHPEGHQEGGNQRGGDFAAENGEHGLARAVGAQVFARGDPMEISQKRRHLTSTTPDYRGSRGVSAWERRSERAFA